METVAVKKPAKAKTWIIAIAGVVLIIAVLAGIKVTQIRKMMASGKTFKLPPESVTTTKVEKTSWLASR